jgi:hypothetical protein
MEPTDRLTQDTGKVADKNVHIAVMCFRFGTTFILVQPIGF